MSSSSSKVRLTVSGKVAEIVGKGAPRDLQLAAAQGALPLTPGDLLTALLFLSQSADQEIRRQVLATLRTLPSSIVRTVAADPQAPAQLLHFIAKIRLADEQVMAELVCNPAVADATLVAVARQCSNVVLERLIVNQQRLLECPDIKQAICINSHALPGMLAQLGCGEGAGLDDRDDTLKDSAAASDEAVRQSDEQIDDEASAVAEENLDLSKYQLSLDMPVAEKIKTALTGDKEWRTIFLRDANKLVSGAVLKNPRITEGEVLAVARNRSASDELIRLILLNNEWLKNTEIRKALVVHPRTPLPKALRFMTVYTEKELKQLTKSRNVSQVIVNNARRMLMAKNKKKS
jgi:hypothetical protein